MQFDSRLSRQNSNDMHLLRQKLFRLGQEISGRIAKLPPLTLQNQCVYYECLGEVQVYTQIRNTLAPTISLDLLTRELSGKASKLKRDLEKLAS